MNFPSSTLPQRILMTADTVGGVWTYSLELARLLEPFGVEVTLATMGQPLSDRQWEEANRLENLQVFESRWKLEWMEHAWHDVDRAGEWLLRLEDRLHPDIIHLNGYAHGSLPWDAPVLMVGHSCVYSWNQAVWGAEPSPEWGHYRERVRAGLRAADMVVAPTRAMLSDLKRWYGPLPPSRVLPNTRNPEQFKPGRKEPFVFAAGRVWDYAKNLSLLAAIAPRLEWPVFVAGDNKHPEHGVNELEHVHLLGQLAPEEIADRLSRAAIYALPARYEPFGLSALEAALSGCALVLGDIPSLREVWGDAALYVHPNHEEELLEQLNRLIRDEEMRDRYARAARQRAFAEYGTERQAQGYLQAYSDLLDQCSPFREREADEREALLTRSD